MGSVDIPSVAAWNPPVYPNGTTPLSYPLPPLITSYPFYYSPGPTVFPGISDQATSLAAPVIAYWVTSIFFHMLDTSGWKWLEKYRLHESSEVTSRNLATRAQVIKAVIFQQCIQTLLGVFWMTEGHGDRMDHAAAMHKLLYGTAKVLGWFLDAKTVQGLLDAGGSEYVYICYWWSTPIMQFLLAAYVPFSTFFGFRSY